MKNFIGYKSNIPVALDKIQYFVRMGCEPQHIAFTFLNGNDLHWTFDSQTECDAVYNRLREKHVLLIKPSELDMPINSIEEL